MRPLLLEEGVENEIKTVSFPTTTEALGRGIELIQHGIFDYVHLIKTISLTFFIGLLTLISPLFHLSKRAKSSFHV